MNKRNKKLLEEITTLDGTIHFKTKQGIRLKIWILVMTCNTLLTIYFISFIKQRYDNNQIITTIDPTYDVIHVPFPVVSICNFNVVSLRESQAITKLLKQHNVEMKIIENFFRDLPLLTNLEIVLKKINDYNEVMSILKRHYYTVDTIMEEVHQTCENLLLHCSFNRKEKKCGDLFKKVKTTEGYCCTFNYVALNDRSENPLTTHDEDFDYYEDNDNDGELSSIIATSESGRFSGLNVVFNVEPEDYPLQARISFYGAKILITDPNDYPETNAEHVYIVPGQDVNVKVIPKVFQSAKNLRRVDPERRTCWFHDEVLLEHTPRYSFETCKTECKMDVFIKLCGCLPYKYPKEKSTRICEFSDWSCLRDMTVKSYQADCNPKCFPECIDKRYSIIKNGLPFLPNEYPLSIRRGHNISNLAAIKVYYSKSTCNSYNTSLLFDTYYYIATYGGILSLGFGASVITFFEVTFITLRKTIGFIYKYTCMLFRYKRD